MNIEIDFEVFKKLTAMRKSETETYNDVLRQLLGLSQSQRLEIAKESPAAAYTWTSKGVTFPASTEFRSTYRGQTIYGRVEAGALVVDGKRYNSPSAAAVAITGNPVNGWIFWECKLPGKSSWQIIKSLRR
jgi:predicted CopG family antitoxin